MCFVDLRNFKTNKRVVLFCKELVSRSMNLNQHKSKSLLEAVKHFNVEVGIYYFLSIYYFNPIFKF